jgi:aryl-alcohol dehydrogenase-like predicted oxidoreductase
MEKRMLGKTGERLSVIGFGGIAVMNETPSDAARIVATAVDRGINYFDVAPTYGNSEERLGPALKPYRKSVFLACKTTQRKAVEAGKELRQSLERLCTDHFDLYQFHGLQKTEDVDIIFGPGGAMEAFQEAKAAGLIRHIGFSAHSEEAAMLMLDRFAFDSVLFPVNFACWQAGRFGQSLLARVLELGIGALALKTLARRPWIDGETRNWPKCWYCPVDQPREVELAVRFTLSKGVTAAVSPSHAELLWLACDAAENYTPLTGTEEAGIVAALGGKPLFP